MAPVAAEVASIARACAVEARDLDALRTRMLAAIRRVITVDAAFFAAADPGTLAFTYARSEAPLAASAPQFLANELAAADVNHFRALAVARQPVATLDDATRGRREDSARYREIIAPLRLGDELRVALRARDVTWGFLCLHREGPTGFSRHDVDVLRRASAHAATAIRRVITGALDRGAAGEHAVILVDGDRVAAITQAARAWLDELTGTVAEVGAPLPLALLALVRRVEALDGDREAPPAHGLLTTRRGTLLEAHAARLDGASSFAITLAPAGLVARASFRLAACGLTPAQQRVAALVVAGRSTDAIARALTIADWTVQDHLKAVFDKVGVRSRRELVAALQR
ncbi:MAG: LuxR C-terminal-related transcriptional regulator [Acidobacteriota bacterium]